MEELHRPVAVAQRFLPQTANINHKEYFDVVARHFDSQFGTATVQVQDHSTCWPLYALLHAGKHHADLMLMQVYIVHRQGQKGLWFIASQMDIYTVYTVLTTAWKIFQDQTLRTSVSDQCLFALVGPVPTCNTIGLAR